MAMKERRTFNAQTPTFQAASLDHAFDVGCSMLNVECSLAQREKHP
jgi:hypothetical protein